MVFTKHEQWCLSDNISYEYLGYRVHRLSEFGAGPTSAQNSATVPSVSFVGIPPSNSVGMANRITSSAAVAQPTFTAPGANGGTSVMFSLVVTDNLGTNLTNSATVTITVNSAEQFIAHGSSWASMQEFAAHGGTWS